jgi:predicted RND superfamily exporter protein
MPFTWSITGNEGYVGTMMATGVLFCMIAALTVVPAILVVSEKKLLKVYR